MLVRVCTWGILHHWGMRHTNDNWRCESQVWDGTWAQSNMVKLDKVPKLFSFENKLFLSKESAFLVGFLNSFLVFWSQVSQSCVERFGMVRGVGLYLWVIKHCCWIEPRLGGSMVYKWILHSGLFIANLDYRRVSFAG